MAVAKFKVRDKVRIKRRVPPDVMKGLLPRTRTIVKVTYSSKDECNYYELGGRGKGRLNYLFRSYMLEPVSKKESLMIGRPREKRKYKRHT